MTVGQASGWVGRNSVSLSLRSNGAITDTSGFVGSDSVSLRHTDTSVYGNISGFNGHASVNLSVSRRGHNTSLFGFVGRNSFSMDSREVRPGEHRMSGRLGAVNMNLTRRDGPEGSSITGTVNTPGRFFESVDVRFRGQVGQGLEAVYPLLGLMGPVMHLAAGAEQAAGAVA